MSHLNDCKLFCPNDLGSTDVHGGFLTFLHFYSSVALALAHTLTRTLDARSRARRNKQTGKNTVKPANNGLLGKWTGDGRGTKELNTGIVASSGKLRPVRTGMGSRKHVTPSQRKCEVHTRTCSKTLVCLFYSNITKNRLYIYVGIHGRRNSCPRSLIHLFATKREKNIKYYIERILSKSNWLMHLLRSTIGSKKACATFSSNQR